MTILSWNVNGLRSVYKKGFTQWLQGSGADIVCLQEIKTQEKPDQHSLFGGSAPYRFYAHYAEKPGYSGVAVYTKEEPGEIKRELGHGRFDREGRMLHLEYPGFVLLVLYVPHGGRAKENLEYKLEVYESLFTYLKKLEGKRVLLAGDFNIAHEEIDLARPGSNKDNIMFTSEERRRIDRLVGLGFADTFREFVPGDGHYTWWSYMAEARERNIGWRIDYMFTSKELTPSLKNAFILDTVSGSDHCPVGIELEVS